MEKHIKTQKGYKVIEWLTPLQLKSKKSLHQVLARVRLFCYRDFKTGLETFKF
jgi:hypothetical protein